MASRGMQYINYVVLQQIVWLKLISF